MANSTLPISRLINVAVNLAPNAAQSQNLSILLLLGASTTITMAERYRVYTTLAAVATDFGTTAPEYLAAVLWFQQNPQPTTLWIGRWAQSATSGTLTGGTLSTTNTLLATWTAITAGSFQITINGVARSIKSLNFGAATNLNNVASTIQTALAAAVAGTTCTYDAVYNRFIITVAGTTGTGSTISYAATGLSGGTDISAIMGGTLVTGAAIAQGVAAESPVACVTYFDNNYGQQWYATTFAYNDDGSGTPITEAQHTAVAAYIEGASTKHIYGITTTEAAVLNSTDTTSIAYLLSQLAYNRTVIQYSSYSSYAVVSYLARILTVNYAGNSTTITLMYKQEPGIIAENLPVTSVNIAEAKFANLFLAYNNNTAIVEPGVMTSGQFTDTITGLDWFSTTLQTAVYNALYLSPTKIPQTDAGMQLISAVITSVCEQALTNGLIGPGTWTVGGFGQIAQGQFLPRGYYIYAPPVATQTQSARATRLAVPFQIALKLAGAVQYVNVTVNVNA